MSYFPRAATPILSAGAIVLALCGPAAAAAQPPAADAADAVAQARANINLSAGWTRATPGNATNAAVYLRIANVGMEPDRLVGVRIAAAGRTEIHTGGMEGGVMRMQMVQSLPIPAMDAVTFAPNGNHLMLVGLKAPLRENESFLAVLELEKGGSQTVSVKVMAANAMGPPAAAGSTRDITSGATQPAPN